MSELNPLTIEVEASHTLRLAIEELVYARQRYAGSLALEASPADIKERIADVTTRYYKALPLFVRCLTEWLITKEGDDMNDDNPLAREWEAIHQFREAVEALITARERYASDLVLGLAEETLEQRRITVRQCCEELAPHIARCREDWLLEAPAEGETT